MKRLMLVAGWVVVCLTLGCGKGNAGMNAPDVAAVKAAGSTLGKAVWADYVKMLDDLSALVGEKPDAATVKPKVAELRTRYVAVFVEHGRKREALDADGREGFDGALRAAFSSASDDMTAWLTDAVDHYRPTDAALADDLAAFNTLTQYANFEVLRKQKPDEAKRLGL